jgi:hypothetical protein
MIQLKPLWPVNDTIWKRWRRDCAKEKQKLINMVSSGKDPVVKDLYKRKSIKKKFYFDTDGLFGGKCTYCETFIKDFQRGDIEHYRPKLAVTDEKDQPIMVDYGNGPEDHHGYYWLCYDQENLLPSCTTCNQATELEGEKSGSTNVSR